MAFLQLFARLPDERELRMFNAMMVILVEHGITPSSLATRMTLRRRTRGSPGGGRRWIVGIGVGVIRIARQRGAAFTGVTAGFPMTRAGIEVLAREIVDDYRARKEILPGIGHPFHKPIDPRAPALFRVARRAGYDGPYIRLMNGNRK